MEFSIDRIGSHSPSRGLLRLHYNRANPYKTVMEPPSVVVPPKSSEEVFIRHLGSKSAGVLGVVPLIRSNEGLHRVP